MKVYICFEWITMSDRDLICVFDSEEKAQAWQSENSVNREYEEKELK